MYQRDGSLRGLSFRNEPMRFTHLTPERQKMLVGVAACAVLVLFGLWLAPETEVDSPNSAPSDLDLIVESPITPEPPRRIRTSPSRRLETQGATVADERAAESVENNGEPAQTIPPSYRQRLALLAEEEETLNRRRGRPSTSSEREPAPLVSVASVEAADDGLEADVEQALAQARNPSRMRRVELIGGDLAGAQGQSASPRGAWLSGQIEIE
jgi:hypothetical protein